MLQYILNAIIKQIQLAEFEYVPKTQKFVSGEVNLSYIMLKMAKHVLEILRCEHCKIFQVWLAILQHFA